MPFRSTAYVLCLVFSVHSAIAQKEGFRLTAGFGTQRMGLLEYRNTYTYDVYLLHFGYERALITSHQGTLAWLAESQFALGRFTDNNMVGFRTAFEAGGGFGLMIKKRVIAGTFEPYIQLLTGPHFISDAPARQVPGFIFMNIGAAGMRTRLGRGHALDLRLSWRHLSNAGIKSPNGGINSINLELGWMIHGAK